MKKRCTNPSCRRQFRVTEDAPVCPYCGKIYPRVTAPREKSRKWAVILTKCGPHKLATIKAMRTMANGGETYQGSPLGLRDAKYLTDNAPSLAANGISQAEAEKWVAAIAATDSEAIAVPVRKLKNMRVFVLPSGTSAASGAAAG